jgi:hemerythrin
MTESSWTDDLSLGIEAIDLEHQRQVALLDAIAAAIADGRPPAGVLDLIDQLVEYTNAHFLAEQLMMRLHAYPLYSAHVTEHDGLLAQARALRAAVASGADGSPAALVDTLRTWLLTHIRGMDRTYDEYAAQPGVTPAV